MDLVWLALSALGLIVAHEGGHVGMASRFGARLWRVVWDLRHLRIGVHLDTDHLTPAQLRWTLVAAPMAEAVWVGLWVAWHPALAVWWRWILPIHWVANWLPVGKTDGARFWATWRSS